MSDVSFAHPWVLALTAVVPVALAVWWRGVGRALERARSISRAGSASPPYAAAILFSLAAVAAIVAAAQPRWGTRESEIPRVGADLVVVIDVSRSMDARDVAPSRLQAAKAAINGVMDRLGGDRIGLVIFAGEARVRFPLTTDFAAARQVIDSLQTGDILVDGGTSAALGLEQALTLLDEGEEEDGGGKVLLLITDGDDLGGDPASAALLVQSSGADLLVAGIGTPDGGTVPLVDPLTGRVSDKLDEAGVPIITKLNEPFLRAVSAAAGGRYLGSDLSLLPGAVDGRLRTLERSRIEARPAILPVERYQVFAGAALALLVLASLVERFGRFPVRAGAALAVVLALFLGGCASDSWEANEAGREAMQSGDYELAIEKFLEVQVDRPDDPQVALNLAAAYGAAGRYQDAIAAARRALASNNPATRREAYSSVGHHQFGLERLQESLDAFRRALLEDPSDDDARHDYEVVLRLLFPDVEPTPTAEPSVESAGTPTPPAGTPGTTPGGGSSGGGGIPTAVTGTPTPAGSGGGQGSPTSGAAQSQAELNQQIRALDREIARLLEEAGEVPTAQEALRILRLLAERAELAAKRDALGGKSGPRDY